jgi:hypothetical protein
MAGNGIGYSIIIFDISGIEYLTMTISSDDEIDSFIVLTFGVNE